MSRVTKCLWVIEDEFAMHSLIMKHNQICLKVFLHCRRWCWQRHILSCFKALAVASNSNALHCVCFKKNGSNVLSSYFILFWLHENFWYNGSKWYKILLYILFSFLKVYLRLNYISQEKLGQGCWKIVNPFK